MIHFKSIYNFLFPENIYCIYCNDFIDPKRSPHYLCDKCIDKITWLLENPYERKMNNFYFDDLISCTLYNEIPKKLIIDYKYGGKTFLKTPLARLMYERLSLSLKEDIDYITYIPSSKNKEKIRGFNQAYLLGKEIEKLSNIPLKGFLNKKIDTKNVKLGAKEDRKEIVEGSFTINEQEKNHLKQATVLIIDDVLTSGSTASYAAKILKDNGAKKVIVLVFSCGNGLSYDRN